VAWRGLQRWTDGAVGVISVPSCVNDPPRGAECKVGALRVRRVESKNDELERVRCAARRKLFTLSVFTLQVTLPTLVHARLLRLRVPVSSDEIHTRSCQTGDTLLITSANTLAMCVLLPPCTHDCSRYDDAFVHPVAEADVFGSASRARGAYLLFYCLESCLPPAPS
jgi:hypothetical protein